MITKEVVELREVLKVRDKLIRRIESQAGHEFSEQYLEHHTPEQIYEECLDWFIEELKKSFNVRLK